MPKHARNNMPAKTGQAALRPRRRRAPTPKAPTFLVREVLGTCGRPAPAPGRRARSRPPRPARLRLEASLGRGVRIRVRTCYVDLVIRYCSLKNLS